MSVTVPPKGTRGRLLPRFLARFGNRFVVRQFRRGGARTQGGIHTLLLETVGARSGERREAVLGFLDDPIEGWMVIASAVGAARHPEWLYNLARQPDVTIEFEDGRRIPVHAETLEGDELVAAWDQIGLDAPEYLGYRSKADREIAVIRLRRRAT